MKNPTVHPNWDEFIGEIQLSINLQKQQSIKCQPFYLVFGRQAGTPYEVIKQSQRFVSTKTYN